MLTEKEIESQEKQEEEDARTHDFEDGQYLQVFGYNIEFEMHSLADCEAQHSALTVHFELLGEHVFSHV